MSNNPIRLIKDKVSEKGVRFLEFTQEGAIPDLDIVVVLFDTILIEAAFPIHFTWMDEKTNTGHLSIAWKVEEKKPDAGANDGEEKEPWWVK
jgi:hypothetical protein